MEIRPTYSTLKTPRKSNKAGERQGTSPGLPPACAQGAKVAQDGGGGRWKRICRLAQSCCLILQLSALCKKCEGDTRVVRVCRCGRDRPVAPSLRASCRAHRDSPAPRIRSPRNRGNPSSPARRLPFTGSWCGVASGWLYWPCQDSLGLLDPPRTTNQETEGTVTNVDDW